MRGFFRSTQHFHYGRQGMAASAAASMRGFTLVEVLMAVFVLAVALAGMMHLHLAAMRAQRQSSYQAAAAGLAGDMAEMIRAWAAPDAADPFLFRHRPGDPIPAAANCLGGATCDPAALRRFGIAQWLDNVQAALPLARVSICRDAAPWAPAGGFRWACSGGDAGIVIKLGWRAEDDDGGAPASSSSSSSEAGPRLVLTIGEPAS